MFQRYVDTCIQYLLRFLTENSNLTTLSTLAALFSLEGLMQDKTLTHETLLYEYEVMRLAINMFGAHDYAIKYDSIPSKYYSLNICILF